MEACSAINAYKRSPETTVIQARLGIDHQRAILYATMRRLSLHKGDLPLRLVIAAEADGRFRYVILRKDGKAAETSPVTFATEAAARAAGGPVLRRRTLAAKLTPYSR